MLTPNQLALLQAHHALWDRLDENERSLVMQHTIERVYPEGTLVYSTVRECIGVLLVERGELRTYILSQEGREVTLFRTGARDVCVLSASCVLQNITFEVLIEAAQETRVLCIPADVFATLQQHNLYVENFALQSALARFSDVMWAMQQILFMSMDGRLAVFLLEEVNKTGERRLTLTQEQIAKYIGSAREVVSRMLRYFAGEGWVMLSRGGIEVVDAAALEALLPR